MCGLSGEVVRQARNKSAVSAATSAQWKESLYCLTKVNKNGGWFAGLTLYDPKNAEMIFENEIKLNLMWDGWTDQGTMYPLFNSLLDYLREQK